MATVNDWLEGARLRTLPAAAAPVFVGAGAAVLDERFSWGLSLSALTVALLLQIGVNFSNDYSDGIRGTDEDRVGPTRLTASGLVPAKGVLAAALGCFVLAGLVGVVIVWLSQLWWLLAVGALAIAAAWFYTGGKNPYGYAGAGLSEAFVFVFFGLVATVGTAYVQTYSAPWWLWLAASGIGLASVALLMVNNVRDIPSDTQVGKRTLAVRMGDRPSRSLYVALLLGSTAAGTVAIAGAVSSLEAPVAFAVATAVVVGVILVACALPGIIQILRGSRGRELLATLRNTGLYALAYGVIVGVGLAVAPIL